MGIVILVSGVVLGMGVSSIPSLDRALTIGLLVLALALFALGFMIIRRFRSRNLDQ